MVWFCYNYASIIIPKVKKIGDSMVNVMIGILIGMSIHYSVCKYSSCINNCDCNKWKGLR